MMINKQSPYYDDYDSSKKYTQMLAVPGRALQAREITQMNTMVMDYIGRLGNAAYSEGTIISGCALVINDKKVTITSGRLFLGGLVHLVDEQTVTITGSGSEVIGAKVVQTIVTSADDPTLLDPAQGYKSYNQEGCNRVKEEVKFYVNNDGATTIYSLVDGNKISSDTGDNTSSITDLLARRTYEESGNYKISGLLLQDRNEVAGDKILLTLTSGKAYILGYEILKNYNSLVELNYSQTTRSVANESKIYYDTLDQYAINNSSVKQINSATAQVQVVEEMTRGNISGGTDYLKYTPTVSIKSIVSGSITYTEGTDFQLTTDGVDWSLSGKEPSIGTTYTCTYIYNKVLVKTTDYTLYHDNDSGIDYIKFTADGSKPVHKSYLYINYDYYLARKDLVCLNRSGEVEVIQGTPDISRLVESPINQDENRLTIGSVLILPNSSNISIYNVNTTRLTESDLYNLLKRVQTLEYNSAINDLDQEALNGESSSNLSGILTDGFIGSSKCDLGNPDFNCSIDINNEELSLPYKQVVSKATPESDNSGLKYREIGRVIVAPYTDVKALSQPKATGKMLVNPYAVYQPMSLVKISPEVDNWIDTSHVSINKTSSRVVYVYHNQGTDLSSTTSSSTYDEVETYMRQIDIQVTGTNFADDADNISCKFNNTTVPLVPTGTTTAGSNGNNTVRADSKGSFTAKFRIPPNTPSGSVAVVLSNGNNTGTAIYESTGISRTITDTTTVLTTRRVNFPWDPVAQSFSFDSDITLTKIGLYFSDKASSKRLYVQIRNMVNGFPGVECYAEAIIDPADITTSSDASSETIISMNQPVYCAANTQYCICVLSDSNAYLLYTATLGEKDITTNEFVTSQPYGAGVLFSSSNALTWTAHQSSDLKFNIYKAQYTGSGTVQMNQITSEEFSSVILAAQSVDYTNSGLNWYYKTTSAGNWLPLPTYVNRDMNSKLTSIDLKAEINTTANTSMSPFLASDCINSIGLSNVSSGTYITRTITVDEAFTIIRLIANVSNPTGTSVKFYYMTDKETTWTQLTDTPTISPISTEYSRYEIQHTCTAAHTYKLKIELSTSNTLVKPKVKKLINILRY